MKSNTPAETLNSLRRCVWVRTAREQPHNITWTLTASRHLSHKSHKVLPANALLMCDYKKRLVGLSVFTLANELWKVTAK